ncbi:MAG: hypothetical protein WA874_14060 [Chryseosolibacter sp.]
MKKPGIITTRKRELHPMPKVLKQALTDAGLWEVCQDRTPYQRNAHAGGVDANPDPARHTRTKPMLEELKNGGLYTKRNGIRAKK